MKKTIIIISLMIISLFSVIGADFDNPDLARYEIAEDPNLYLEGSVSSTGAYCTFPECGWYTEILGYISGGFIDVNSRLDTLIAKETIINVTPNITLPNEECEWEKVNEELTLDFHTPPLANEGYSKTFYFLILKDMAYSDYQIINTAVLDGSWGGEVRLTFNGVVCLSSRGGGGIPAACIDELKDGINTINVYYHGLDISHFDLYQILLEMEIKPANC